MMADNDRGEPILDEYANTVRVSPTAYHVTLIFGRRTEPAEAEEIAAIIRMSPQLALVVSKVLEKVMRTYQESVGKIELPPRLFQDLGLEEK